MASETLHYENARAAGQLFNNDPRNLDTLQEQLGVKATSREGWIKLDGAVEAIELAKNVFQFLEKAIKEGHPVRNRKFPYAVTAPRHDGTKALQSLGSERIQTSPKKS